MPKVGMKPIRRAQLIEATLECIHRNGFAGTTIAKVSKLAGVSTGIVSHYFGDKDGLLEATMRDLLKNLGYATARRHCTANSPHSRIMAIINSNFSSEQIAPNAVTAWLSFWANAMHVPTMSRLQKVNMHRLRSNLRYWLKQLLPPERAILAADGLAALIDGLWLRGAFQAGGIDTEAARRQCLDYLELQLAAHQEKWN